MSVFSERGQIWAFGERPYVVCGTNSRSQSSGGGRGRGGEGTHAADVEVERLELVVLRAGDLEQAGRAVLGSTSRGLVLAVRVCYAISTHPACAS